MELELNIDFCGRTAHVEFKLGTLERVGRRYYCQSLDMPPRRLFFGTMTDAGLEPEEWVVQSICNMIEDEVDVNGHVNVEFAAIDENAAVYRTWSEDRCANEAGDEGSSSDSDPCLQPRPPPS